MNTFGDILRLCVIVAAPLAARAGTIEYEASGTFTNSAFPSSVAVGDTFTCRLAYEDAVIDSDSSTNSARFNNAITAFAFSLSPGASGNYAGGALLSPAPIRLDTPSNYDLVYILLDQGFGSINGATVALLIYLLDYSHSSPINDLGSGQSLGAALGGLIDLNDFRNSRLTLSIGKSSATGTISTLRVVSPPRLAVLRLGPEQLRISWPVNATSYSLETAETLAAVSWTSVTNLPVLLGDSFSVTINSAGGPRFYRLHKQ